MLYDTIKIVKYLDKLPKEAVTRVRDTFYWNNCLWKPRFNDYNEVASYSAELKNLKLWLRGSELTISNSLQKFYSDNNYQAFTYSQVVEAIKKLDTGFDFDLQTASVSKIAIGVVINDVPENTFGNWLEYKSISPYLMRNKTKVYGAHFKATNYNIKGYDKTYQVKQESGIIIPQSSIRFEIEANTRYYNHRKEGFGIHQVSDLMDKSIFEKLGLEMLNVHSNIKVKGIINYQNMTPNDIKILAAYSNSDMTLGLKKHHKHTYKKERSKYLKLLKKIDYSNTQKIILNKLEERVKYCIEN